MRKRHLAWVRRLLLQLHLQVDLGEATLVVAPPRLRLRKKIYTEAARIINDDLPEIYFWSPTSIFGLNKRLVGFQPPGYANNKLWNAEEWAVTK